MSLEWGRLSSSYIKYYPIVINNDEWFVDPPYELLPLLDNKFVMFEGDKFTVCYKIITYINKIFTIRIMVHRPTSIVDDGAVRLMSTNINRDDLEKFIISGIQKCSPMQKL